MKPELGPVQSNKAWQRYVKRQGTSQQWQFLALASPALHPILEQELTDAGFQGLEAQENGICFFGQLRELYRAHISLRSCSRLFLRMEFRASSLEELHRKAQNLPWEFFLPYQTLDNASGMPFQILCHTRNSRISLPVLASRSLGKAITQRLQAQWHRFAFCHSPSPTQAGSTALRKQRIHLFIQGYRAQLLLDASGMGLHQHGYRQRKGQAALREDLAAGLLLRILQLRYARLPEAPPFQLVLDGMCGSATLLCEAFLAFQHIPCRPPALYRYAFEYWPMQQPSTWQHLCEKARKTVYSNAKSGLPIATPHFLGLDSNEAQFSSAQYNTRYLAELWPELPELNLQCKDFFQYSPAAQDAVDSLLLLNPPYGHRLGRPIESQQSYARLARRLQEQYACASILILVPEMLCGYWQQQMQRPTTEIIRLRHGGLRISAYFYIGEPLPPKAMPRTESKAEQTAQSHIRET